MNGNMVGFFLDKNRDCEWERWNICSSFPRVIWKALYFFNLSEVWKLILRNSNVSNGFHKSLPHPTVVHF